MKKFHISLLMVGLLGSGVLQAAEGNEVKNAFEHCNRGVIEVNKNVGQVNQSIGVVARDVLQTNANVIAVYNNLEQVINLLGAVSYNMEAKIVEKYTEAFISKHPEYLKKITS